MSNIKTAHIYKSKFNDKVYCEQKFPNDLIFEDIEEATSYNYKEVNIKLCNKCCESIMYDLANCCDLDIDIYNSTFNECKASQIE